MKILLFVGDNAEQYVSIRDFLIGRGNTVKVESGIVDADYLFALGPYDFLISYGYRHIIKKDVIDCFERLRRINLHISYLPWNRSASLNLFSWLDGTPKGVTIHCLDKGINTGDILLQEEVRFDAQLETLTTSYEYLHATIRKLFMDNWVGLGKLRFRPRKQVGRGSCHRSADKEPYMHLLIDGWDTPVSVLENYRDKH